MDPIGLAPKRLKRKLRSYMENRGFTTNRNDLSAVLTHRKDVPINTVIGVGASDGRWSAVVMHFYPAARYLLVEAQVRAHG